MHKENLEIREVIRVLSVEETLKSCNQPHVTRGCFGEIIYQTVDGRETTCLEERNQWIAWSHLLRVTTAELGRL